VCLYARTCSRNKRIEDSSRLQLVKNRGSLGANRQGRIRIRRVAAAAKPRRLLCYKAACTCFILHSASCMLYRQLSSLRSKLRVPARPPSLTRLVYSVQLWLLVRTGAPAVNLSVVQVVAMTVALSLRSSMAVFHQNCNHHALSRFDLCLLRFSFISAVCARAAFSGVYIFRRRLRRLQHPVLCGAGSPFSLPKKGGPLKKAVDPGVAWNPHHRARATKFRTRTKLVGRCSLQSRVHLLET
jgi:hypothetical protein